MRRREFIGANKVQAADQPDDYENTGSKIPPSLLGHTDEMIG